MMSIKQLFSKNNLFKDHYFLLLILLFIGLIIFKWQDLYLPYFSDELWSYGPAVRKMAVFGSSLLPSSLDLNDHFAHPLLFFFLAGLWASIFGASLFSTHLFASLLSILLLLIIYIVIKQLVSKQVAFYSVIVFAFQSIFLGQFSLVLPEILLTIFTFLVIYFSEINKLKWYFLFGCCLVLTKESGVFPVIAILLWNFIRDIFYDKISIFTKANVLKYVVLALPLFALILHFLLLKSEYGWFIMPLRVESFEFSWNEYHHRLMSTIHYVFIGQGRKPLIIILFFVGILFYNKLSWLKRLLLITVSFVLLKVFFRYWIMPEFVEFAVVPFIFLYIVKSIFIDVYKTDKNSGGVISIFSIITIFYILFISSFFDSRRYLFFLIPMIIIITNYFIANLPKFSKYLLPLFSILFIVSSFQYQFDDTNSGDDTNHYSNLCMIQKKSIEYLENNYPFNQPIQTTFLFKHSIERPLTGYLNSNNVFTNVSIVNSQIGCNECLVIFVSTELPDFYNKLIKEKEIKLEKEFQKRNVWIKIYKYKKT